MNMYVFCGLFSWVLVISYGSGGGFSVKDGVGGSYKIRKMLIVGLVIFFYFFMNLI